jgi:hypothetical protein
MAKRYLPEAINFLNKLLLFLLPEYAISASFVAHIPVAESSKHIQKWRLSAFVSSEPLPKMSLGILLSLKNTDNNISSSLPTDSEK